MGPKIDYHLIIIFFTYCISGVVYAAVLGNETSGVLSGVNFAEGGSIHDKQSNTHKDSSVTNSSTSMKPDDNYLLDLKLGVPMTHNSNISSVKPRKGAEFPDRIVARKGVSEENDTNVPDSKKNDSLCLLTACQLCKSDYCKQICCNTTMKIAESLVTPDDVSSSTEHGLHMSLPIPKKKKLKPEYTEIPDDLVITFVPNPSGMKDYVILIVTCLVMLPIVFVAFLYLFKKFRDFWETRNYRRMDFLIDGIYNN